MGINFIFQIFCRVHELRLTAKKICTRQTFSSPSAYWGHTAKGDGCRLPLLVLAFAVWHTLATWQTCTICRVFCVCRIFSIQAHGKYNLCRVRRLCRELFCRHMVNVSFAVCPINGSRQTIWHTANVLFPVVLLISVGY